MKLYSRFLTVLGGSFLTGLLSLSSSAVAQGQAPTAGQLVSPMGSAAHRGTSEQQPTDKDLPEDRQAIGSPGIPGGIERLKRIQQQGERDRARSKTEQNQPVRGSEN